MLNQDLFEQRRSKVMDALERAKMSRMDSVDNNIRPLLCQINLIERVKPEDTIGAIQGANQVPFILSIRTQEGAGFYSVDLSGNWIDDIESEAMIPWFVNWVRQGIRNGKLPGISRIEATKDHPGQDEHGRIIPKKI